MKSFGQARKAPVSTESWLVIYTDLMTIIMVFFVILWSINQRQDEGISETVGDQTVNMINLPGDVLFSSGQTSLTAEGKKVIGTIFNDPAVLNFDTGGLVKRLLVVHGHTDSAGEKEKNFDLGFKRAYSAYRAIGEYSKDLPDHVVICTHADNSPAQEVPVLQGKASAAQRRVIQEARKKNRRITIEDKMVNKMTDEDAP